ncbi:MAG: CHAD domain-containing protein [Hamadaea sp.]|uniref:CHAD domain-containing protein n=1 Tax=Hamadaea sp. TaxID=2024425 RepID=UPI0017BE75DC|nr:CHAD domain-containing protein [Hamadaea sp.]NUR70218.1 CHAD domain-containing protein [Hamadaea sp.]NUT21871.1 CHAD domain-containing protein [Hamadaea sp.]
MPRSAAAVLRRAADGCADGLLAAEPLIRANTLSPDGDTPVHDARVAVRRLRSVVRTFTRTLDEAWSRRVRANLKWLADLLGAARDAEVLRARLRATGDRLDVAAFDEALRARAEAARTDLLAGLDSARLPLLVALLREPEFRGRAHRPAKKVLPRPVRQQVRRYETAVADLTRDSPIEQWHRVRILAKRARYALDIAGHGRRAKELAKVQSLLGEHQDAVVAARAWRELAPADPRTASRLVERELAAAQRAREAFLAAPSIPGR